MAACNPARSGVSKEESEQLWINPKYTVHDLHPTLHFLKWNYGALQPEQEDDYINVRMRNSASKGASIKATHYIKPEKLASLVTESQTRMRTYSERAYQNSDKRSLFAKSAVSQRDIERLFTVYEWVLKCFGICKPKSVSDKDRTIQALLFALGIVYYLRLGQKDRQDYEHFLDNECRALRFEPFSVVFKRELDWFVDDEFKSPPGIAKTSALKENIVANMICCQTHTPLIIIGKPGTSKTLSFNLTMSNLQGRESKSQRFRKTDVFKGLLPVFYQCSRHTSSTEVEGVFQQAIERQRNFIAARFPVFTVVFLDEVGLPEDRHESLKALHYHLDNKEVSFVAITNHALDAAKTNRAVCLFRPAPSLHDLEMLAISSAVTRITTRQDEALLHKLCCAFSQIVTIPKFNHMYGQRDFVHFIRFLYRTKQAGCPSHQVILQALERNLNGHEEFNEICQIFFKEVNIFYCVIYSVWLITKITF